MPEPTQEPTPVYRVVGTGPVRVLISPGWVADSTLWDPFLERVDGDRFSIALVEHRGYGSARHQPAVDLLTSAGDLLRVADRLEWDTVAVLGHSMGALVAQRLCALAPHRLRGVILYAPVPASGAALDDRTREERVAAVASSISRRESVRRNAAWTDSNADRIWRLSLASVEPDTLITYLRDFTSADFADTFTGTDVPALVITGADDPATTTAAAWRTIPRWFSRIDLIELPGTGHYGMQQAPGRLLAAVEPFLKATSQSSWAGTSR